MKKEKLLRECDLKIGNLLSDIIGIEERLVVYKIEEGIITCGDKEFSHPYLIQDLVPIEITNEILTSLGFKLYPSGYYCKNINSDNFYYTFGKTYDRTFGITLRDGDKEIATKLNIKYVHELQNLHYSLTGTLLSLH